MSSLTVDAVVSMWDASLDYQLRRVPELEGSLASALTRAMSRVERCLMCYLCRPRHALNGIVAMERCDVMGDGRSPWVMNRVSFGEEGLTSLANATSDVETPVGMDQPDWGRVWVPGGTIVPAPSRPGPCVPQAAQGPPSHRATTPQRVLNLGWGWPRGL